jgi:iron complex transport system ATP-binding protein
MIQVESLGFSYNKSIKILNQIDFIAKEGHCLAVLGNNGAGKSTMIKCLSRILEPQEGTVIVNGRDVSSLKRKIIAQDMAYVLQKNESPKFTVYDTVLMGRKPYIKLEPTVIDHKITRDIIERMNLKTFSLRYIDELSSGELQKVMLARALAQHPKVLMLDEPTSNLDLQNQYKVMKTVHNIAKEDNICIIIVIHDINLAIRYCDSFLLIKDSSVYSLGGVETVTCEAIRDVYGIDVVIENVHGHRTVVPL